jgi:hypothetical protein
MENLLRKKLENSTNAITEHHLKNLLENKFVQKNGSIQTVFTRQVNDPRLNEGKPTLIPSIWDSQELNEKQSIEKAIKSGKQYPTRDTHPELREFDIMIHKGFDEDLNQFRAYQ